ncbi:MULTISPECIES: TetR/AcrR family transcriptional regulator [unclassified Nocardioides]|uniref:TetR/AcrR family transcriptional regulator n=1 Tax=unclassified Nocardioides TaxID=2615069 RepID=UPI00361786E2
MEIDQAERMLDAAAGLFAEQGVEAVGMGEIARAAGCSRATLYRYFEDRHALHRAFIRRAARDIGVRVAVETAPVREPAERLTAAILTAVRLVRESPELVAWFGRADAGTTAELALSDEVIEGLGLRAAGDADTAQWLVRVIVSLLIVPGRDEADERALLERYVVPGVLDGRR